jgi:hypothetical protein
MRHYTEFHEASKRELSAILTVQKNPFGRHDEAEAERPRAQMFEKLIMTYYRV